MKRPRGRPPGTRARTLRDKTVVAMVSDAELEQLKTAAGRAALSLSSFARHAMLTHAARVAASILEVEKTG